MLRVLALVAVSRVHTVFPSVQLCNFALQVTATCLVHQCCLVLVVGSFARGLVLSPSKRSTFHPSITSLYHKPPK